MKKTNTHLVYGAIIGLAMVIVNVILYVADLSFNNWAQWISHIPFIIGLILNAQAFSKANNADITFGQAFGSGFKASAVIALITLVWSFIAMAVFPEMQEKGMEVARARMTEKGMSDEQIEQGIQMTQKYFKVFMVAGVIFGTMFFGAIYSLIAAAIAKKNPNNGMPPAI
jgi:hypothetical protein